MNKMFDNYFNKVDYILVSSRSNIVYLTGYSGFSQIEREGLLLIGKNKKYIITDGRYSEAIKNNVHEFELIDVGAPNFIKLGYKKIRYINKKVLGVEENNLTVTEFKNLKKIFKKLINIDLSQLRSQKKKSDIENIKLACKISDNAFNYIIKELKIGVTEKEIAGKIANYFKNHADNISFNPTVAFGKNSSIPHHTSGSTRLTKNSIVLLDFGAWINNFCSDLSRTIFFGKADKEFKKIYNTVYEAQKQSIESIKSGVPVKKADIIAREYIKSKGYPDILHSVGHGIGIDVHEPPTISPRSSETFRENMTVTIEPGIYLPGYGGVRIEDIALVRSGKAELISKAKRNLIEIND